MVFDMHTHIQNGISILSLLTKCILLKELYRMYNAMPRPLKNGTDSDERGFFQLIFLFT